MSSILIPATIMIIGELESGLIVVEGLTPEQGGQLILLTESHRDHLKHTSDSIRFASHVTLENWLKQERTIYSVSDAQNPLLGIAWFRRENTWNQNTTFAIRLYLHALGKGLALPFMNLTFDHYLQDNPESKIWLEVAKENKKAAALYEKFGFKPVLETDDKIKMRFDKINI